MIGVIASAAEHPVVREFFELFKTPWEFYCKDRKYDVLLCAGDGQFEATAGVVIVYAGRRIDFDNQRQMQSGREWTDPCILSFHGKQIPIYGDTITFPAQSHGLLARKDLKECAAYLGEEEGRVVARIGYDLFAEIHSLLTVGQPAANANLPALELHIELLRNLVTGCGIPLVEIPPIPDGYQFVACLTHDVDHPSIRQHKWDHTMFGFLYRAIFGSLRRLLRGQISFQDLRTNWMAALKLPFVHLGLAKDFWREFDDRYLELEKDLRATFFVIPFSNRPGSGSDGPAPMLRATRYRARDLADTIRKLKAAGCEVGLHGIDVWLDSSKGQQELDEIRSLTGATQIGVRMHWLYYDQQSPLALEEAGAAYDSTVGYNETVGYRAGTTQVFKPLDATRLLELPLHVMDTALFYPSYRNLSPQQARMQVRQMADNAAHFGGTLTINWHDRSMAPERLWGACYRDLIQDLQSRGAWFSTAGQAVSWFRKRRSAAFDTDSMKAGMVRAKVAVSHGDDLPGLRLRTHKAGRLGAAGTHRCQDYVDKRVDESIETFVPSEARR